MKTKWTSKLLIILLTVFTFSTVSVAANKPSYMFVIQSKYASLKKVKKVWKLTLYKSDIKRVLAFTDRPFRIAKDVTADKLSSNWTAGSNSFAKDHPNAVLVIGSNPAQPLQLLSMKKDNEKLVYHVSIDSSKYPLRKNLEEGPAELFIDACAPMYNDKNWC